MASVIAQVNRPTLVLAHNKTLAAQLYQEFKAFFPRQRGRVLRLLLRLLPARGLRPAVGHLHREGVDDQRGDRPAAPLGHPQPVRAARRRDRGLGLLHLRPRLARGLLRDAAVRAPGRDARPARPARAASSRRATTATTTSCGAAPSACAATWSRSCRPTRRAASASSCSATRSSASAPSTRSPGRRRAGSPRWRSTRRATT